MNQTYLISIFFLSFNYYLPLRDVPADLEVPPELPLDLEDPLEGDTLGEELLLLEEGE